MTTQHDQLLAQELWQLRQKHRLKQEEMASILECSRSRMSRLESTALTLSKNEWFRLVSRFPDFAQQFNIAMGWQACPDQVPSEVPNIYQQGRFLSIGKGNCLAKAIGDYLGDLSLEQFWKNEQLADYRAYFSSNAYPYVLIIRMMQWLKIHFPQLGQPHVEAFLVKNRKYFFPVGPFHQEMEPKTMALMFLESWQCFSRNYDVRFFKNVPEIIEVIVAPKQGIENKLCFGDPIISSTFVLYIKSWWNIFLNRQADVKVHSEGDAWIIILSFITIS